MAGAGAATFATSQHLQFGAAQATPGVITIPEPVTQLPTDNVTFRWIDSGDLKAYFYREYFAAYQQAHPNITIQYDALPWAEIAQLVPLGVRNGDAHDVFAMPPEIPSAQAVREGWVAPLDDIIPNFAEWKARFPLGAFQDGVHVFDGKTYTFPVTSNKRYSTLTFFNPALMEPAGYNPAENPLSWDELRDAAKKITDAGQGQSYGLILGGKETGPFADFVGNLARMAGRPASSTHIDWLTGEYVYGSDEYVAAVELLLAINADGSIFPGALSLGAYDARARFPTGVAGMILSGPWDIVNYQRDNPEFAFGISSSPVANGTETGILTYEESGANLNWVYANSPNKAIAGDMFNYIGSVDGQVAIMAATNGNLRSLFPEAAKIAQETLTFEPMADTALELFEEQIRLGPMVFVRNPETAAVNAELRALTPSFGEVVQGIFSGQLADPRAAMQDLQDRANAELDRAIKAAQDKGAQVSREDWVFPNWDPTQDYTEDMYAAL
jgi:multiple sugar transport system substrate-binding protein